MKLIGISRIDRVDFAALKPHLRSEAASVWRLYRAGLLREFYLRQDGPGVVLVFEAASVDEVRDRLAELPLSRLGLVEFDVIPVGPLLSLETLMAA